MSAHPPRGLSVSSAGTHVPSSQPSLHRVPSTLDQAVDGAGPFDAGRRPSVSPSAHDRQSSQSSSRSTLSRTTTNTTNTSQNGQSGNGSIAVSERMSDAQTLRNSLDVDTPTQPTFKSTDITIRPSQRQPSGLSPAQALRLMSNGTSPSKAKGTLQSVGEFAQQHLFSQVSHIACPSIDKTLISCSSRSKPTPRS